MALKKKKSRNKEIAPKKRELAEHRRHANLDCIIIRNFQNWKGQEPN